MMGSATSEEWVMALAAWDGLAEGEKNIAIGWLASGEPAALIDAAAAAKRIATPGTREAREHAVTAVATVGAANTAVAHLDTRGMREVLNFLAMHEPDAVLLAVRETGA